jgi:hypothetical protein
MFEDREPSIFPNPASAWWIPVLVAIGWGPLFMAGFFLNSNRSDAASFGMAWGMAITFPCTFLAVKSVPVQMFRLLMYFVNRVKPISK